MSLERLRLAELMAALSMAADLGMGQPLEQTLRTCLLALGGAEHLGVSRDELADVYYVSLLRFLGCTADAHEASAMSGGDEIALRAAIAPVLGGGNGGGGGGGGGGGYFGGGGGGGAIAVVGKSGSAGGGGGGSSFAESAASSVSTVTTAASPSVVISWTAPPTSVPEFPWITLTPLMAAAGVGAAVVARRRKMTITARC